MRFFLLLFIILPLFELWLIIKVGSLLGAWLTVALVVATAVVGMLVLRYQGLSTLLRGRERMAHGEVPGAWAMAGGAVILLATLVRTWSGTRALAPGAAEQSVTP